MEAMKNTYIPPRPDIASTVVTVVSSGPPADWHRQVLPPPRDLSAIPSGNMARAPHPKSRDSKASFFERTWSTISSALRDLEPVWAHRRMEAAMGRPYTPSVYSSRTVDDDSTSTITTRGDVNHIINRLSDIVEESWRDRSILKTPEPAALTYTTERRYSPYRGSRSDWDIENGSMI